MQQRHTIQLHGGRHSSFYMPAATAGAGLFALLAGPAGLPIGAAAMGAYIAREIGVCFFDRRDARRRLYQAATDRARQTGAPLLVVGDPDAGFVTQFFGRDYDCGDICTDLTGCPSCTGGIPGPLEEVLPRLPSRSAVVYVSCTLEYVTDLPKCIEHLERVAIPGGLFVVKIEPDSSTFWLWELAKWQLHEAPPDGRWVYRRYRNG